MIPDRKKRKQIDQNITEEEILIRKHDIQYNISTRMHPEWLLHNDVTSRKIFTIIAAKEYLQKDQTKKRREASRRRKNLHKENKERNNIFTMSRKRGIFIEKITPKRISSECRQKGYIIIKK
ncbi:hypothetical protein C922_05416 [Plasmodium inui San Antonio 1]|uniref:Uncharacterized protein n=1 Tax=Plasmodium inui San Antonio 1 TaxID=1237626 RepID=W6ZY41_9APIC|nr:hypothetical protein C922_05416 [Plasmodium inui San Antonio 1]EUD64205.1 hypothetical protein C922_05416 [Plasmodium inui San Antonio 1]